MNNTKQLYATVIPGQNNSANEALQKVYLEFETYRNFHLQRKREIEELIVLLQDWAEAEKEYA